MNDSGTFTNIEVRLETHKANAMHKLVSRIDIVRFALLQGWLETPRRAARRPIVKRTRAPEHATLESLNALTNCERWTSG
jgi:hypothetical protein